ncbi:hypothetical protein [uncultured Metabacillus sp.]|uniref:TolB family protein n=1 Tax=uncultured Metabacillus sp. TaxID=2860135 RepID=UPI00261367CD|nr:hypothetical protein [uncultured Metabacillus sp.]
MYRIFLFAIIIIILFPSMMFAEGIPAEKLKAAFIRDGELWTLINGEENQVTNNGRVSSPKWSYDGKWLLYQQEDASDQQVSIWAYRVDTGEKKKIFYNGYSATWAPKRKIIAFNDRGILNISDFKQFYNIATGVNSYTWLPDGDGFLLSSSGVLRPDGWTSAMLFTKKVKPPYKDIILFGGVDHFFTLPREIGLNINKIIAVYADDFTYSPSNKWISFIVSPTASWSMDSNMLCVISQDGKDFEVLDEIIFEVGEPKWAPTKDIIAYIAGGGRIVYGFKDKKLRMKEMPVNGSLTPQHYTELDFTWINDQKIVTSRVKETEWSNDFSEHPLPSLYLIDIENNKQTRVTSPPKGFGDYHPQSILSAKKLIWLRGRSLTDQNRDVWISEPNGEDAKKWLENVEMIEIYEKN